MKFLPYFYFLRIPLLIAVGLLIFPYIAIGPGHPANPLLGGMFELSWFEVLECGLAAVILFGALSTTTTLIAVYGQERFYAAELPKHLTEEWFRIGDVTIPRMAKWFCGVYGAITAVFLLALVKGVTWDGWGSRAVAVVASVAVAAVIFFGLWLFRQSLDHGRLAKFGKKANEFLGRLFNRTPRGFLLPKPDPAPENEWQFVEPPVLLPGHRFAALMNVVTVGLYVLFALSRYWTRLRPLSYGEQPLGWGLNTPALFAVIALMILFCWILAALSFVLDRYRVPVLAPLGLWMLLSAQFPESDHYFEVKQEIQLNTLKPLDALTVGDNDGSAIVVATTGGGIQAAAWTARVLTGIAEKAYKDGKGEKFSKLVRATSSVSGGSLGILYFADAYKDGVIPIDRLDQINKATRAPSLDDVAWGLLYPDFVRAWAVLLIPREIDRGWAIEQAWRQYLTDRKSPTLDQWRCDAKHGLRPATIFNTTLVDTGERFLLPTVDIKPANGRRSLRDIPGYGDVDMPAVSATRLSASFPYVTPVARARCCPPPGRAYHLADGGYYDNYGIGSVVDLLLEATEGYTYKTRDKQALKRVFLVQITLDLADEDRRAGGSKGWFFQASAPLVTLLDVRNAGQYSHAQTELNMLKEVLENRGVDFDRTRFSFQQESPEPGHAPDTPLSWKLTQKQQGDLDWAWNEYVKKPDKLNKVLEFVKTSGGAQ